MSQVASAISTTKGSKPGWNLPW